jgi:hypothetical protein
LEERFAVYSVNENDGTDLAVDTLLFYIDPENPDMLPDV